MATNKGTNSDRAIKKDARRLQQDTGMPYAEALREAKKRRGLNWSEKDPYAGFPNCEAFDSEHDETQDAEQTGAQRQSDEAVLREIARENDEAFADLARAAGL